MVYRVTPPREPYQAVTLPGLVVGLIAMFVIMFLTDIELLNPWLGLGALVLSYKTLFERQPLAGLCIGILIFVSGSLLVTERWFLLGILGLAIAVLSELAFFEARRRERKTGVD